MKLNAILTLIVILAFAAIAANAQFPNLDKIKEKVKKEESKTKSDKNESNKTSGNESKTETSNRKAEFDQEYPPGVEFSSLLNDVILHPDGKLAIEIIATFLPPAKSEKLLEPYNEVDGGKLEGVIKRADGSVHFQKRFRGVQRRGPFWKIYPAGAGFVQMSPGDYTLELLVEDKLFYRFPFSVVKETGSNDPFAKGAGDKLVFKGAWNEYAYLHLSEGNQTSNLYFKVWLRSPVKRTAKVDVDIARSSDGKIVASGGGDSQTIDLPIRWERREIGLRKPNGSSVIGTDVFGKDGDYKVIVKIDGELYGEYPFTVKDKKFVYLPEQTRGKEDMTTFVEGGNDAFYVKKAR